MTRVKRGVTANKRRKKVVKYAKGYKYGRKTKFRQAKEALTHAWSHAYKDRKIKKRVFRQLWTVKLNAMCRQNDLSYSKFINLLKKKDIKLNRKVLAELSENYPAAMKEIIKVAKA